jgi:hypothetical protein
MMNRETLVPYGIAGLVLMLVAGLVGLDVVASFPSAPATPAPAPAPQVAPVPVNPPPAPNKPEKEVQNLVLFTEVPFRDTKVTTGRRFSRPQDEKPSEQWCYILCQGPGAAAQRHIALAEKRGTGPLRWLAVGPQAAADLGFSLAELEAARGKCRFTGAEE